MRKRERRNKKKKMMEEKKCGGVWEERRWKNEVENMKEKTETRNRQMEDNMRKHIDYIAWVYILITKRKKL